MKRELRGTHQLRDFKNQIRRGTRGGPRELTISSPRGVRDPSARVSPDVLTALVPTVNL